MPVDTKKVPPLPAGMTAPKATPPRADRPPPPPREDEGAWGRWKEQPDDESCAEYMKRIWSVYGEEGSAKAVPEAKAANYYQVDGGDWYWWEGE